MTATNRQIAAFARVADVQLTAWQEQVLERSGDVDFGRVPERLAYLKRTLYDLAEIAATKRLVRLIVKRARMRRLHTSYSRKRGKR